MIFLIEYINGFSGNTTPEEVGKVISVENGITISPRTDYVAAYRIACQNFSAKEWQRNPWQLPILPQYEAWAQQSFSFHIGADLMGPTSWRVFSVITASAVAILTSIENVVAVLRDHPDSVITECISVQEAQNAINYYFLRWVLPLTPYLQGTLPIMQHIPLDTLITVDFRRKYLECIAQVPEKLQFQQPEWSKLKMLEGTPV